MKIFAKFTQIGEQPSATYVFDRDQLTADETEMMTGFVELTPFFPSGLPECKMFLQPDLTLADENGVPLTTQPLPLANIEPQTGLIQVPTFVSMKKVQQHLANIHELEAVKAIIDAIPEIGARQKAQAFWATSDNVYRQSTFIEFVKSQKGWTDAQIDEMFIAASQIDVLQELANVTIPTSG